jgi:membrane protease YdiL (CAAX protease family)
MEPPSFLRQLPRQGARGLAAALAASALVAAGVALHAAGAPQVLLLVLLAPVLEEAVFRAGVQEALLRHRAAPWAANAITAGLFAAAHVLVQDQASGWLVLGPALLIGAAYNRWRRLRWCVLLHAAMNAAWLALPGLHGAV